MNWKFWEKGTDQGGHGAHRPKLAKPINLPEAVGRKMVVAMKMDPDEVWALKYVSRPVEGQKNVYEFKLFNPESARQAGVVARDWTSFDSQPDLVLFNGFYDKNASSIDIHGRG